MNREEQRKQDLALMKKLNGGIPERITLRLPRWLLERVDKVRKNKVGGISRNQCILELLAESWKNKEEE